MNGILVATLTLPALVAGLAFTAGNSHGRFLGRLGAVTASLGFIGAAALAVRVVAVGDVGPVRLGALAVSADRLAVFLLLLVFGVSAVVQAFAVRYLAGDPRAAWFSAAAGLLTSASAGLATAATLVTIATAWTVGGVALCLLLATYWQLPAARDGVRRTAIAFLIGDLALWIAVLIATTRWGLIDLRTLANDQIGGALLPVVACLVVIAALSRSAQIPFHRWLPATLAAPTPVSALLHAGVVNAGGILLVRLSPLASTDPARALTILAGIATLAYGAVIMLVKPDVKGALAHSTMAQMGFMILTCGLGLWAAAVFHLFAHGFYKATLFLSSGSAIAAHRRTASRPSARSLTARRRVGVALTAATLPALALYAAVLLVPVPVGDHAAEHALLIFAWVTGTAATWGWLQRRPGAGGVMKAAAVLAVLAPAYVGLISAVSALLAPALPEPAARTSTVWLVTLATLATLGALAAVRRLPAADAVRRALYTRALSAGHITPARLTGVHS